MFRVPLTVINLRRQCFQILDTSGTICFYGIYNYFKIYLDKNLNRKPYQRVNQLSSLDTHSGHRTNLPEQ